MNPTLLALMLWASQLSGYPIPEHYTPPQIVLGDIPTKVPGKNQEFDGMTIMREGGPIVLNRKSWKTEDTVNRTCVELHELVHYLQYLNGLRDQQHLEPPAYRAMAKCYYHYGYDDSGAWAEMMARTEPY